MTSAATRRRIEGNRPARPVTETPIEKRSTRDLLTAAYALTHRIESQGDRHHLPSSYRDEVAADLRAQRDLITAEVLRRTGDA